MKFVNQSLRKLLSLFLAGLALVASAVIPLAQASPYGMGIYSANVPYGSETSIALSTTGNVNMQVTPTEAGTLVTATNTVTVTSTDVVGYKLYISSLTSSNMVNGPSTISASSNVTAAALASNTWGYNTDASSNFIGSTTTDTLIKTANGPYTAGDPTTVTYGLNVNHAKAAGKYTTAIVYTAAPQTN